jgi:DNA-directed RNA polymerase specialized sigma24 family protein
VLRVLECLPSFDERKGHRNAFIATIVERHAFTIVRDRNVRKRDTRRVSSLNVTINLPNEGPAEFGQTLGERETETRLGVRRRSDQAVTEVAEDVATAIASLPEPLKDLAERLKHQTISEISRDLGISRSTLNHRLVRLRQRFEAMGMREYLAT